MQNDTYQSEQYDPNIIVLPEANNWLRFANMILDYFLMMYPGSYIISYAIRFCAPIFNFDTNVLFHSDNIKSKLLGYIYSYLVYILIFTLVEGFTKGRTLGKFITGTRAVKKDGIEITWKDAFIRSLCRVIPFEQFSAFGGNGLWHDRISKTAVIVVRK